MTLLLVASTWVSKGCYISGSDTGFCDTDIKSDAVYRGINMPFCGSVVDYVPCVPEPKYIEPDRKFNRDGRWGNHTTITKDKVRSSSVRGDREGAHQGRRSVVGNLESFLKPTI